MIVGRIPEIEKLTDLYESDQAELVAVYGRRRVGKTFLVNELFKGRFTFMHSGLSPIEVPTDSLGRKADQLAHFHRSLRAQGAAAETCPSSWLDAFYMLEDLLQVRDDGSRQLVFLDEIQWTDTPKSGFMRGLEAFWNGWACHRNIIVIVCGSSASWMLDRLINDHGGLYDRVTWQLHLMPFDLSECEEYLLSNGVDVSRYDTVQYYMALGGVPYYLRYVDPKMSFEQNMDALFFRKQSPLRNEFSRLFSSTFSNPGTMEAIVRAVGSLNRGLTRQELSKEAGVPDGGTLTKYLESLEEGGFIMRYTPFGEGRREARYKLIDPFCLFRLTFGDAASWSKAAGTAAWRGIAFENVCFNHVPQIKQVLGISGVATRESLWSKRGDEDDEGTQVDLILERADNIVEICEAKFLSEPFSVDKEYHFVLERRKRLVSENVPKKRTVRNILISTYGLERTGYRWDFAAVVTLDDLFNARCGQRFRYNSLE